MKTDFVIRFANVNGTGSASANQLVVKTLFRMGWNIGAKNMFPSNIQGMPTWYEVRISDSSYTARKGRVDIMVAMNGQTLQADCEHLDEQSFVLYDPLGKQTPGGVSKKIPLPVFELARKHFKNPKQRALLQNLIYVGAISTLVRLDEDILKDLLEEQYRSRPDLLPLNEKALLLGKSYVQEHVQDSFPYFVKMRDRDHSILINGNEAAALGAVTAGATVAAWYPITPSTSVMDAFRKYCSMFRQTSDGVAAAIMQSEDEISAIGMVLGANWMGARAFTATSGPGISLMNEFLGYAYYAEIPSVVLNIQRCGPSTGMPTRNQQADILSCAYASHGDTEHLLFFPATPSECYTMTYQAFDFADRFQTPVFLMSDLELGMNEYCEPPLPVLASGSKGKVLNDTQLMQLEHYHRYEDIDGDGIPWRTLPGSHPKGANLTRGSGHDKFGRYTENGLLYQENLDRISKKFEQAAQELPEPECVECGKIGLVYFGSTTEVIREVVDAFAVEGVFLSCLRVKAFPFHRKVYEELEKWEYGIVIEQNRDGQMRRLLIQNGEVESTQLRSLRVYDGLPLTAQNIIAKIQDLIEV